MAISVTPNLTDRNLCEDYTTWTNTGTGTLSNNADVSVQGQNCLSDYRASANSRSAYITLSNVDLSNKNIYFWASFSKTSILQVYGSTGFRIRVYDNNLYYSEWWIAGSDTLPHGGWIPYCFNVSSTPNVANQGGTFNPASVARIEYRADTVAAKGYIYIDAVRTGTGLTITGGDAGTPATFENLYTEDNNSNYKYGVITKIDGVYYLQGQLQIGSGSQTATTYFKDTDKLIVFRPANVGATFYKISAVGANGFVTTMYLGAKSGTNGIQGCVVQSAGASKYSMDFSDQYATVLGLYGCRFITASTTILPTNDTNREVLNCVWASSGKVTVSTCKVQNSNFISATGAATLVSNDPFYMTDCNFISCVNGVEIDTVGDASYDFDNLKFSGNTYDVNNSSGSALTVGKANNSNPTTYTGSTVNWSVSVELKMVVTNEAGTGINGAYAYIDNNDESPYILNTQTAQDAGVDGVAKTTYSGSPITGARWRVRLYGYKNFKQLIDVAGSNISLPVTLVADGQQY
jgi:hypothetical protein